MEHGLRRAFVGSFCLAGPLMHSFYKAPLLVPTLSHSMISLLVQSLTLDFFELQARVPNCLWKSPANCQQQFKHGMPQREAHPSLPSYLIRLLITNLLVSEVQSFFPSPHPQVQRVSKSNWFPSPANTSGICLHCFFNFSAWGETAISSSSQWPVRFF